MLAPRKGASERVAISRSRSFRIASKIDWTIPSRIRSTLLSGLGRNFWMTWTDEPVSSGSVTIEKRASSWVGIE